MANLLVALWQMVEQSIIWNKLAGMFIIMVGLYSLHGHCIACKEPRHFLHRLVKEKYGHEKALNFNLFMSVFTVALGTFVLLV